LWAPNTSHATVNSNGENPLDSATATLCCRRLLFVAGFSRIEASLPLLPTWCNRHDGAMKDFWTVEASAPGRAVPLTRNLGPCGWGRTIRTVQGGKP
jgi:hypothetical protein